MTLDENIILQYRIEAGIIDGLLEDCFENILSNTNVEHYRKMAENYMTYLASKKSIECYKFYRHVLNCTLGTYELRKEIKKRKCGIIDDRC